MWQMRYKNMIGNVFSVANVCGYIKTDKFVFRILINLYDLSALFTWVNADVCSYVSVMTKVGIFISDVIKLHYQWIMSLSVPFIFNE